MVFPYKEGTAQQPVVSLDGRLTRPRPLITVTLIGPAGSFVRHGLVDPGADDTVFPVLAAQKTGIDLTGAPSGLAAGAGSAAVPIQYAKAFLRITDGQEFRQWPAWIGFTPLTLKQPLLGFAGFLQFFSALFLGDAEELHLTVNPLYPGI